MDEVARAIAAARSLFVLTGAGMSAESGLPTFRGPDGYWKGRRAEELASPEGFARDPELVWQWYNERIRAYEGAQPNAGHVALAELESLLPRVTIATQNVDSLHQRAGSRNVIELHGHLREARCTGCGGTLPLTNGLPTGKMRHGCGGVYRPQVVWFGEALPRDAWSAAASAASSADVTLVVGTSAIVYPAASLAERGDGTLFEINPNPTAMSSRCTAVVREPAASALFRLSSYVRGMLAR